MNKKILGLLAASAAVVGSAIFATPARAVQQEVEVNLTVDEVLFLRTFDTVSLRVSQGELGGAVDKDTDGTTDGTALIDVERETGVTEIDPGESVIKDVKELYAVYGNGDVDEDDVSVSITVTPGGDTLSNNAGRNEILAKMSVAGELESERNVDDLNDDLDLDGNLLRIGGVQLEFQFQEDDGTPITPQAGSYTGGKLTVEATTIGN